MVVVGGLIFLACQVYEFQHFYHAGLGFSTSVFATSFYMLTGCHGTHVAYRRFVDEFAFGHVVDPR